MQISVILVLFGMCCCAVQAYPKTPYYPSPSYGGYVPDLPPFGVAAKHPSYSYGSYGYGKGNSYDYKTALRYESSTYAPNGIQSSYAYDVDGQRVQVARIDPAYKSFY